MREEKIVELALLIIKFADEKSRELAATNGELLAAFGVAGGKIGYVDGFNRAKKEVASVTTQERGS